MDTLVLFVTYIAWAIAFISALGIVLNIGRWLYHQTRQAKRDFSLRQTRAFSDGAFLYIHYDRWPWLTGLISGAWLLARYRSGKH